MTVKAMASPWSQLCCCGTPHRGQGARHTAARGMDIPAEDNMAGSDVLIIGAGPTGLVLALWLARLGLKPRIIDKTAEPGTTSRALAVHARTLELYRQLELTDAVVEKGHRVPAINLWVEGERQ